MQTRVSVAVSLLVLIGLYGCAEGPDAPRDSSPSPDVRPDAPGDTTADTGVDSAVDAGDADAGDTSDTDGGRERVQCGSLPSPPSGELCAATDGSPDLLLLQGDVLTENTVFENGSVLVDRSGETASISCTGCNCDAGAGGDNPTTLACPEGVISPGLINAHDHLGWATAGPYDGDEQTRYDHRHEWRTGARMKPEIDTPSSNFGRPAILYGELRHLFGGATSIAGSTRNTTPEGLLRNLDTEQATEGLDVRVEYSTFPLGDIDGTLRDNGCDYDGTSANDLDPYSVLSNDIYLPHVSEGLDAAAENEFECLSTIGPESRDLMEGNTSIVHGIGMTPEDIFELSAEGGNLVWSPRTNIALYGQTADVTTYRRAGVPIALGTDWAVSGSRNLLQELSCADRLNGEYYDEAFSDRELWRMATINGARALGVGDRVGRLAEGYAADIAIFDGSDRDAYGAVVGADDTDVELVMRGGTPLYGDETTVERIVGQESTSRCSSIDVCGDTRSVCAELDTADDADGTVDLQTIRDAAGENAYPLFSCESDQLDQPTCTPSRPGAYDGTISANDSDGDGIADGEDNCPSLFNPERPLEGEQPNADGDDFGDACDPCPTTPGTDCDLDDFDGDGVADEEDNCPFTANADQTDSDTDGVGDACANETTVYELRDGTREVGERIQLDDVVVSAVRGGDDPAIWVQVPRDASRFQGVEQSGIFVDLGSTSPPERGDRVGINGRFIEQFDRQQIARVTDLEVQSSGGSAPSPEVVDPCDIATGGSRAQSLQGVLVRVEGVTVTDGNPDGPGDDFGEFAVGDCSSGDGLRVDDDLHAVMPDPQQGDAFNSLTGPLHFSFGNAKLEPRDASDAVPGSVQLDSIQPGTSYLKSGANAVPKPSFEVVLSGTAQSPQSVSLSYPNSSSVSGPSSVTVSSGSSRESVSLQAGAVSNSKSDFATVEASLAGTTVTADVLVYDDSFDRAVDTLTPTQSTVASGTNFQVTARLDIPAPSGGTTLSLSSSSDLSLPSTSPTVSAGDFETTFTVGSGSNSGQKSLTATADGSGTSTSVTVNSNCLIISEYIEGSGSNNKAIELYNCGSSQLDLSKYGVCIAFNSSTSCGQHTKLSSVMLSAGSIHAVCKSKTGSSGDPVQGIKNNCDQEDGGVINFNGNDRLVVFRDQNNNGTFDPANDTKMDQFGEVSSPPSGSPWADTTYRRCDTTPYLGNSSFTVTNYFTSHPQNDASNYGTAPTSPSCP